MSSNYLFKFSSKKNKIEEVRCCYKCGYPIVGYWKNNRLVLPVCPKCKYKS